MQLNESRRAMRRRPAFINRTSQLEALDAECAAALAGELRVVSIVGDPGIGKSRLIAEFFARTGVDTPLVVECLAYAPAPLAPFADLARALVEADPDLVPGDARASAALARLVPGIGAAAPGGDDDELERRRLFNAVADLLDRAARRRAPLVVALEDLQWADTATLALLRFVVGRVAAPVLLLLTYRAESLAVAGPLRSAIAELHRSEAHRRLTVDPLPVAYARELVVALARTRGELPEDALAAICARADGHPLFLTELLSAAFEAPADPLFVVPLSIDEIIRARLERLAPETVALLEIAAALGRRFDPHLLALVSERGEAEVTAALVAARTAWIVVEHEPRDGTYAFRHELVRDALRGRIAPGGAAALHRRILDTLAALPDAEERLAELAEHAFEARDMPRVLQFAEAAGDRAASLYAYDDAARSFERALALERLAADVEARLHEKAANARYSAGDLDAARRHFEAARRLAREDRSLQARALLGLAKLAYRTADVDAAAALNETALALLPLQPPSLLRAQALINAANYGVHKDAAAALRRLDEAAALGVIEPSRLAAGFYHARAWSHYLLGDVEGWKRDAAQNVALAAQTGDPLSIVVSATNVASCAIEVGELDLAIDHLRPGIEVGERAGIRGPTAYARVNVALVAFLRGDLANAREHVLAALDGAADVPQVRLFADAVGLAIARVTGHAELRDRCADPASLETAFRSGEPGWFGPLAAEHAERLTLDGRHDEAQRLLHRALLGIDRAVNNHATLITIARVGTLEDLAAAEPIVAQASATYAHRAVRLYGALFRAYAARRRRQRTVIRVAATEALAAAQAMGARLAEAQAHELLGAVQTARDIYAACGALAELRRLEPASRNTAAGVALTRREREIARLVARARANREIAQALCISERTVENHVAAILGKLGLRSRVELAASLPPDAD